jgi:hypothetical protein
MSNVPNWKDNVAVLPPSEIALSERLQNARLERSRIAEERDKREAAAALVAEVEAEERALRDEQAIEKAVAEYGELGGKINSFPTTLGVVILKKPHHVIFRKFQDLGEYNQVECEKLVRSCLVHPDKSEFDRYIQEQPGILVPLANLACALAGVKVGAAAGK